MSEAGAYAHVMSDEEQRLLAHVLGCYDRAEKHHHKTFREKGERFLRRYHNFQELRDYHRTLEPPDRDVFLREKAHEFGIRMTIPYAFATVETVHAQMLANPPRMLVLPRALASERNVQNVKFTIDAQQERINYQAVAADVLHDGLTLGLGFQKTLWRTRKRMMKILAQGGYHPLIVKEVEQTQFDGPVSERVDPFDCFWDPFSDGFGEAERRPDYMIHRTWRSTKYVLEMMERQLWQPILDGTGQLDKNAIQSIGPKTKYTQVVGERMRAQGHQNFAPDQDGVHEIWEYHDGEQLVTILDGCWVAVNMPNPYWHGEQPFQAYRPTKIPGQMPGKGEIEPIEDLCDEMDQLRTDRRDNARMKLNAPLFYDESLIDARDITFGPGWANPVRGNARDAVWMPNIGDVPNAGYQEEVNLARDIERASGISDTLAGSESSVQQTATGAQILQAAASVRIKKKAWRLQIETIKPAVHQWIALLQQKTLEPREVRVAVPPTPNEPDRRWLWFVVGPQELQGEFDVEPAGGMEPENLPQRRQDAQAKMAMLGYPEVDRRAMMVEILGDLGMKQPEAFLAADDSIPIETLRYLIEAGGVDPKLVEEAVAIGRQAAEDNRQGPPQPPAGG